MKSVLWGIVAVALLLGGVGQSSARAGVITFDFSSVDLSNVTDPNGAIESYMNAVLAAAGQSLRVTAVYNAQAASGTFGSGNQGNLSGTYVENSGTSGNVIEFTFNEAIVGLSVDYVVIPGSSGASTFDVSAHNPVTDAFTTPYSASVTSGSTGMLSVFADQICFSGGSGEIAIDNLVLYTNPEPASLGMLCVGALGVLGYSRRRKKAVVS